MPHPGLDVLDDLPRRAFEPAPIDGLDRHPQLDDQVIGIIRRLSLAPLLPPEANERRLVVAHYDPCVGAADEALAIASVGRNQCRFEREGHDALQFSRPRTSAAASRQTRSASADTPRNS